MFIKNEGSESKKRGREEKGGVSGKGKKILYIGKNVESVDRWSYH